MITIPKFLLMGGELIIMLTSVVRPSSYISKCPCANVRVTNCMLTIVLNIYVRLPSHIRGI